MNTTEQNKYNLNELNKLKEDGWLESQSHPTLPLTIWNYSRKVQFDKIWNEFTLNIRGTILDSEGNVVARSFSKFFNWEELEPNQIPLKGDYVYVQDKVDGSLGILFNYNNEWVMCTKGSFVSEQCIKGMEILKSKYNLDLFMKEYTYLVEIIYSENRIVVDYKGKDKLIFLSITSPQEELHWTTAKVIFKASGIKEKDIVKTEQHFQFSEELYKSLKQKNETNKEGFVLRFQPGNFRMKIKFEDYVRLHKLVTNITYKNILKSLIEEQSIEYLLSNVPDEIDDAIKKFIQKCNYYRHQIREDAGKRFDYKMWGKYNDKEPITNKKEYAEWVFTQPEILRDILFKMFDKKDYELNIWKKVEQILKNQGLLNLKIGNIP